MSGSVVNTIKLPAGSSSYCVVAGGQVEIPLSLVALSGKQSDLSTGSANGLPQPMTINIASARMGTSGDPINHTGESGSFSLQAATQGNAPYLLSEVANNGTINSIGVLYATLPPTYVAGKGFTITANAGVLVTSGTLSAGTLKSQVYVINNSGTASSVNTQQTDTLSAMSAIPGAGTDLTFTVSDAQALAAGLAPGNIIEFDVLAHVVNGGVGTIQAAVNSIRIS